MNQPMSMLRAYKKIREIKRKKDKIVASYLVFRGCCRCYAMFHAQITYLQFYMYCIMRNEAINSQTLRSVPTKYCMEDQRKRIRKKNQNLEHVWRLRRLECPKLKELQRVSKCFILKIEHFVTIGSHPEIRANA